MMGYSTQGHKTYGCIVGLEPDLSSLRKVGVMIQHNDRELLDVLKVQAVIHNDNSFSY